MKILKTALRNLLDRLLRPCNRGREKLAEEIKDRVYTSA